MRECEEAAVSKFLKDVKRQYEISETEERANIVEIRQMDPKIPTTLEMVGTVAAWMAKMKKEAWFINCMHAYVRGNVYRGYVGMQLWKLVCKWVIPEWVVCSWEYRVEFEI